MERAGTPEPASVRRRTEAVAVAVDESLPLLNPAALLALADQVGDNAAQRFFTEYVDRLPARVSRIIRGLGSGDLEASRDAVVSLKVSSATAGAVRMEHYCRGLEERLAAQLMPDLAAALLEMSKISRLILQDVPPDSGCSPGLAATPGGSL